MSKRVFVLGGTKGLGREIVNIAAEKKFFASVASRGKDLIAHGPYLEFTQLDLKGSLTALDAAPREPFDYIFITAGVLQKGSFSALSEEAIEECVRVNFEGPAKVLAKLLKLQKEHKHPCHITIVSSTTSWKVRNDEAMYGASKAAMAQLARNLGRELRVREDLPGSKVLLVNPGGMNTPFWEKNGADVSSFMDPAEVAKIIWHHVDVQDTAFWEIQVLRQPDGSPNTDFGSRKPD